MGKVYISVWLHVWCGPNLREFSIILQLIMAINKAFLLPRNHGHVYTTQPGIIARAGQMASQHRVFHSHCLQRYMNTASKSLQGLFQILGDLEEIGCKVLRAD
jgi:hypothetical protein